MGIGCGGGGGGFFATNVFEFTSCRAFVQAVTTEWVELTFGPNPANSSNVNTTVLGSSANTAAPVNAAVLGILLRSWEAYENYTSSLGWGFTCSMNHYDMSPSVRQKLFINASRYAIGFDRSASWSYAGTYNGDAREWRPSHAYGSSGYVHSW